MSEFRTDPLFGSFSIISRERASRPQRIRSRDETQTAVMCSLCPGNEALSPPEIARIERPEGKPGMATWRARAFANAFPAIRLEAEPKLTDLSKPVTPFAASPGFGVHELIVDGPNHSFPFWALDPEDSMQVLKLIQNRLLDLQKDRRLLYVQAFKNHRAGSGASQDHPHFQLIGLPFVPNPVMKLISRKDCGVCSLVKHEITEHERKDVKNDRLLTETSKFIALADFAPEYSYQFSIYPKKHSAGFEAATDADLEDLAQICTLVLGRFERMLGEMALNFVIFTQPNPNAYAAPKSAFPWKDSMHWFIRVYPRLSKEAGFELSTDVAIVQVAPEDAARAFREKGV